MDYIEFEKRTRAIRAQEAIISLLDGARILSAQMYNVQAEFERNDVHGFIPGTVRQLNEEHRIVKNTAENLMQLIDAVDNDSLGLTSYIVRDLLVDYEHGNFEFEE